MPAAEFPPRGPWKRVWILACALIVFEIGGLELFWRMQGHRPSISPSMELWCYHRDRLHNAERDTIAVLGGSRIEVGFDQDAFLKAHPRYEVVQLALPGKGPFATLADVAADESFRGTVICSLEEVATQPSHLADQDPWVSYYRQKWGPGKKASLLISVVPQNTLAQLLPRLGGINLLRWLRKGRLPLVDYTTTLFNRRRIADYSKVKTADLVRTRVAFITRELKEFPPATESEWRDIVARIAGFVRQIQDRGGRVVIVKYPLGGELLALQEKRFPRDKYWEPLAAGVGTDVIHYEEMPGFEDLSLPDDSHLDPPGATEFTLWLGGEMQRRGVID